MASEEWTSAEHVGHYLADDRKRSLYAEVFERLEPGGLFANFEHVAAPTHRLHLAF